MKIKSLGIGICMSLFGTFCLGGCSGSSPQQVSRTVTVFDTVVTITVYDKDSEDVLDACVAKCEDYNARFSRTSEGSEIYELNHANGDPVTLSGDTVDLIQKGVEYSRLADGKFDITIAPLSDLWDFKNNTGTVPDDAAIQHFFSPVFIRIFNLITFYRPSRYTLLIVACACSNSFFWIIEFRSLRIASISSTTSSGRGSDMRYR